MRKLYVFMSLLFIIAISLHLNQDSASSDTCWTVRTFYHEYSGGYCSPDGNQCAPELEYIQDECCTTAGGFKDGCNWDTTSRTLYIGTNGNCQPFCGDLSFICTQTLGNLEMDPGSGTALNDNTIGTNFCGGSGS